MSTRCTQVSATCPVERTTYGYAPVLWGNALYLAIFAILTIAQLGFLAKYRLWSYTIVVAAGCALECIGYGGRIMLHANPWSDAGFKVQIVCLIFAPSLLAAGVYLTFKHLVIFLGREHSRLKAELYTWIFIGCDLISIILQAAGGGISAAGSTRDQSGVSKLNTGRNIMVAGIAFQVVTMGICGLFALDFGVRYFRLSRAGTAATHAPRMDGKAKLFFAAVALAFLTIWIRCIYRLPELIGGWGGALMRKEVDFMILDGLMIIIAGVALTAFYPGIFFPNMIVYKRNTRASDNPGTEISLEKP